MFDFNSISEVKFNIRYSAREGKSSFAEVAKESIKPKRGIRILSLKHHYYDLWQDLLNKEDEVDHVALLPLISDNLWYGKRQNVKEIDRITLFLENKVQAEKIAILMTQNSDNYNPAAPGHNEADFIVELKDMDLKYPDVKVGVWDEKGDPGEKWMLLLRPTDGAKKKIELEDLVMVVEYSLQEKK